MRAIYNVNTISGYMRVPNQLFWPIITSNICKTNFLHSRHECLLIMLPSFMTNTVYTIEAHC